MGMASESVGTVNGEASADVAAGSDASVVVTGSALVESAASVVVSGAAVSLTLAESETVAVSETLTDSVVVATGTSSVDSAGGTSVFSGEDSAPISPSPVFSTGGVSSGTSVVVVSVLVSLDWMVSTGCSTTVEVACGSSTMVL